MTSAQDTLALLRTLRFFIDGQWVEPVELRTIGVVDPATEQPVASVALGSAADVDRAVAAARRAFPGYAATSVAERLELLRAVGDAYKRRLPELAEIVSLEMGAPIGLARKVHAPSGFGHFATTYKALAAFQFEEQVGTTTIVREPVGVCGLITPWNWPLNQIAAKVAPALATGCTVVLKPSELAPLNALVFAEILDEAGVPAGVFNLVNGDGPTVGTALSEHPDVDMVSFTGSTRAGVEVARAAAPSVKRVAQELGGKSANIVLDDADIDAVVARDVTAMYENSGQSCNAASRILVPASRMDEAVAAARRAAESIRVGAPRDDDTDIGPVASLAQFDKIQALIQAAIDDGATLVAGGLGRPATIESGYFVRPTVFAHVSNDMRIAREEIFGPVVTLIAYEDDDDAVRIANDSVYGLSGRVSSSDDERARAVARRLRTGMIHINGAPLRLDAPFGGYKQSGNGREFAAHGIRDFLEVKSIFGDVR